MIRERFKAKFRRNNKIGDYLGAGHWAWNEQRHILHLKICAGHPSVSYSPWYTVVYPPHQSVEPSVYFSFGTRTIWHRTPRLKSLVVSALRSSPCSIFGIPASSELQLRNYRLESVKRFLIDALHSHRALFPMFFLRVRCAGNTDSHVPIKIRAGRAEEKCAN